VTRPLDCTAPGPAPGTFVDMGLSAPAPGGPDAPAPPPPRGLRFRWWDDRPFLTGPAAGGAPLGVDMVDIVDIDEPEIKEENGAV
jgi:hypothetical protein